MKDLLKMTAVILVMGWWLIGGIVGIAYLCQLFGVLPLLLLPVLLAGVFLGITASLEWIDP